MNHQASACAQASPPLATITVWAPTRLLPPIVSIFLGDDLAAVVDALINDKPYTSHPREKMDLGVPQLADLTKDSTDRNRTSPFAFTGNKFEFRMCGSRQNLSDPNMVLNTAVAEKLDKFATDMADVAEADFLSEALAWVKKTLTEPPAHHLQRQRLLRRVARRGREAWPAQHAHHAGRPAVHR